MREMETSMVLDTNFSPKLFDNFLDYEKSFVEQWRFGSDEIRIFFIGAVFKKDFGPWKVGDKPHDLMFYPAMARLVEGDQWELLVKECFVQLDCKV